MADGRQRGPECGWAGDGQYRDSEIILNGDVVILSLDGTFSHPLVLQDGENTIAMLATDLAGNETTDTRTIYLDRSAPVIEITSPADNVTTRQAAIDVAGVVDEQSTVTVKLHDSAPVPAQRDGALFSLTIKPVYGINTIEITATDLAGNTSTMKRTVTYDDQNPSLSSQSLLRTSGQTCQSLS